MKPRRQFTSIGKKEAIVTTVTPVQKPRPTKRVTMGAMATTGTLRSEIAKGNTACAVVGDVTNSPATNRARTTLNASPTAASLSVNHRLSEMTGQFPPSASSADRGTGIR